MADEGELRGAYAEVVAAAASVYADLERTVERVLSEPPPGWAGRQNGDHADG